LRLLLDGDTQARRLVLLLRAEGHDIPTVSEMGRAGAPDHEVVQIAVKTDLDAIADPGRLDDDLLPDDG